MKIFIRIKEGDKDDKWTPKSDEINCVGIVEFEEMRCVDSFEKKAVPMIAFVETYLDEKNNCEVMTEWRLPVDIIESVENLSSRYAPEDGALCDRLYEVFDDRFFSPSIKELDKFKYPYNFICKCFKTKSINGGDSVAHFVITDWDGKQFCVVETKRILNKDGKYSFSIEKRYFSKNHMAELVTTLFDRCSFDEFREHYVEAHKHIDIAVNDSADIIKKILNK